MKSINNIIRVISTFTLLMICIIGVSHDFKPYSYWLVLMVNVYMLWCTRKNMMMFIISLIISYSNYSIIYANFINHIDDTMYTQVITNTISNRALNILTIFNLSLVIFINWGKISTMKAINLFHAPKMNDNIVLAILTVVLTIVFFIGFKLPDVQGERGTPKPIYEYAISFFILYFYYSGNKKNISLGLFFVVIYSLQNFLFGGRIYGLQFILVAFLMLFIHKFTIKKMLVFMFPFFVLFNIIGILRGSFITHFGDFGSVIFKSGLTLDTAYSAYYTSPAIIFASDRIGFMETVQLFIDFIVSIFLGETSNQNSNIQHIAYKYINHSYGCVMPFYFCFYFGILGSFVPVFILKIYFKIICNLKESTHGCFKCIAVFIVAHTFRWYLYSPLGLFRGVLFLVIVYYCMYIIHSMFSKKRAL